MSDKKIPTHIRLDPDMQKRLESAVKDTGLLKITIIRQGIEKRLKELGF
jgi:predicted DNA-binding protein